MRGQKPIVTLSTLSAFVLCCAFAAVPGLAGDNLDGAYDFVRLDTPDGPNTSQEGMMIVSEGYMCHIRVAKDREKLSREDAEEIQIKKQAAAFSSVNGTCGSFKVAEGKISVTWATAVNPNQVGNTSDYVFDKDGDTLSIGPASAPQFRFVYRKK